MSNSKNKRAVTVGIFIIAGLTLLVSGILVIGNLHSTFTKKVTVFTVFDNVNGLEAGDNILFSGVKIGTVKNVEFHGSSQVKVILNINADAVIYIRRDAKVQIGTDGLIGNKVLVIIGGTAAGGEITEGDELGNVGVLTAEDIMATIQQNNLNILALTEKISSGEGTLGKLINDDSLYNSFTTSARSLELATANAQLMMASLAEFSTQLNQEGTLVYNLMNDTVVFANLASTIQQLNDVTDTAQALANNMKDAQKNPNTPLGVLLHDEVAGAHLKNALANMESSSAHLDEDLVAVQHTFLLRKYFRKRAKDSTNVKD